MTEEHIKQPEPHEGISPPPAEVDPAMASLADALRVSFRVLTGIMIIFVVLFLATGIASIEQNEKGVIKRFGKVVGLAEPGLAWNWPFPIGEIQRVNTQQRRLLIETFWMNETAGEKLRPLAERRRKEGGLAPGWDGYLLAGDRNLIHVRFECVYSVQDPVAFVSHISDLDATMKSVLCSAAIQAAATRTSDAIQSDDTGFLQDLQREAQKQLDVILGEPDAIRIAAIVLPTTDSKTWPLGAYSAYEAAQRARSEREQAINNAIGQAKSMMNIIGELQFVQLVGEPWESPAAQQQKTIGGGDYNLIGQLQMLESQPATSPEKAKVVAGRMDEIQAKINALLTSPTTGGEVSALINEARSEKTRTIQTAQRRAQRFEKLYAEYKNAPTVFLEKTWAEALDEVLSAPTVQKWYVDPGQRGMILRLKPDPQILKELQRYYRKQGGGTGAPN